MNDVYMSFRDLPIEDIAINSEPKFCIDCNYYSTEYISACCCKVYYCKHPNVIKKRFDIITGEKLDVNKISAYICRKDKDKCGPDADWFKPKEK